MEGVRFLLLACLCSILISTPALGVALGVNKAELTFDDVLREGYAQDTFLVSTDSQEPIGGALEIEGEIEEWLSFEPEGVLEDGFEFSAGDPQQITAIIEPPADAANDAYEGSIRVLTGELSRTGGGLIGTTTRAAFRIEVDASITGVENLRCSYGGFEATSTEIGQPFELEYAISNSGNVRVDPTAEVVVYDQLQEEVVHRAQIQGSEEVLPTTSQRFLNSIEHELPIGQYWVRLESEMCGDASLETFDVLDRGGVVDRGELVSIDVEPWNEVGEIIPITAVFKNTGPRTASAKFKGTVMRGQKLFKVIDTDLYSTPPGETARIETFFNPSEPGQYEVEGRVVYNEKLTYGRSAIINVEGDAQQSTIPPLPAIALLLAIIILLLLIRRKKKRRW